MGLFFRLALTLLLLSCCTSLFLVWPTVVFASYGTPYSQCGAMGIYSSCHASNSTQVVSDACLNKQSCQVLATK